MSPAKMAESIEMPFGRLSWVGQANHVLERSRSDESIRRREGWQEGDVAFRQNSLTTCYCLLPFVNGVILLRGVQPWWSSPFLRALSPYIDIPHAWPVGRPTYGYLPGRRHCFLAATHFLSHPAEGRRLSWPEWLVT